jgi:4,5-DOPA dioxygenase extradiol
MAQRMPAAFVGHGSPMNTLERNRYTEAWHKLGRTFPKPRAILAISAHWYVDHTAVTAMAKPPTIHDFFGFPEALQKFHYPAPGDPKLAARVRDLLAPVPVTLDQQEWGLDHGTWSVLAHMYPKADVPVVQLAIDQGEPNDFHYAVGQSLKPLRDEGVLILGLGNVVHNLRMMQRAGTAQAPEWAASFETHVRHAVERRKPEALINYESAGPAAKLAVPSPEHYLPLLYVIGVQHEDEPAWIPTDGIDMGSISMLSVVVGEPNPDVLPPEV